VSQNSERPKTLVDEDRGIEVYMMGDYVAVAWNVSMETETMERDGRTWSTRIANKQGVPYITFVTP